MPETKINFKLSEVSCSFFSMEITFSNALVKKFKLPILLWDERFSTIGIIREMKKAGIKKNKIDFVSPNMIEGKAKASEPKEVLDFENPSALKLPSISLNSRYIFANEDYYFVYKNNYNHFANLFRNTYQHGGISLEEMIGPFIALSPR